MYFVLRGTIHQAFCDYIHVVEIPPASGRQELISFSPMVCYLGFNSSLRKHLGNDLLHGFFSRDQRGTIL